METLGPFSFMGSNVSLFSMPLRYRYLLLLLALWALYSFLALPTLYWRDAGELTLAAIGLDVSHPPGYPSYATISNIFTLIPLGPLAWRVSLSSVAAALAVLLLTGFLTNELLLRIELKPRLRIALSIFTALFLIKMPAFMRQALTPEAYMLNAALAEFLLLIFFRWQRLGDTRLLYGAAFIAGLGIGNHVSLTLVCMAIAPYLIWGRRNARAQFSKIILFGILGLAVYGYLPLRAAVSPWLNSGDPSTVERFIAHITDSRDRELPKGSVIEGSFPRASLTRSVGDMARRSVDKFSTELSIEILILALAGFFAARKKLQTERAVLLLTGLSIFLFFSSWDTDPWIPLLAIILIFSAITVAQLVLQLKSMQQYLPWILAILYLPLFFHAGQSLSVADQFIARDLYLPRQVAKDLLERTEAQSSMLTEGSSFMLSYLKYVERYRDDVQIIYPFQIRYPEYFGALKVSASDGAILEPFSLRPGQREADKDFLKLFYVLRFISGYAPLFIEPALSLNYQLRNVIQLTNLGTLKLVRGEDHKIDDVFIDVERQRFEELYAAVNSLPSNWRKDARHHMELLATNMADLLLRIQQGVWATTVLSQVCGSIDTPTCSPVVLTNISSYLLRIGQARYAAAWGLAGLKYVAPRHPALKYNLGEALQRLTPAQINELALLPGNEGILHEFIVSRQKELEALK